MLDIVSIIASNICSSIFESLKDKVKTKLELQEMEKHLKEVFSSYEKEYDLERISIHLQTLVPQMVSYCSMPNGVSLSQKAKEYVDLLRVPSNKQNATAEMIAKVLNIINNTVNSVRSHDAKSIENRQEQRHMELADDHAEIKTDIKDIKKELENFHKESVKIDPIQNLRAKIVQISDTQSSITIEAIRDAVPFATFAVSSANNIDNFWLILTGSFSCGRDILRFDDGTRLNAHTFTPHHIQVAPGFPCEVIVENNSALNDYSVWIMTSKTPSRYSRIPTM